MNRLLLALITFCISTGVTFAQDAKQNKGKHLFLLSGQSNMSRFKPKQWFTPGIHKALGAENVIVCFEAKGGQPISKWFKGWKNSEGETDSEAGQLYDALMEKMKKATDGSSIQSVTFVWMQGEAYWTGVKKVLLSLMKLLVSSASYVTDWLKPMQQTLFTGMGDADQLHPPVIYPALSGLLN